MPLRVILVLQGTPAGPSLQIKETKMPFTESTIPAGELKVGDFVDRTPSWRSVGPRGGRYLNPAYRVGSAVTSIETVGEFTHRDATVLRLRFSNPKMGALLVPSDSMVAARVAS
jgi:hypothetical protein